MRQAFHLDADMTEKLIQLIDHGDGRFDLAVLIPVQCHYTDTAIIMAVQVKLGALLPWGGIIYLQGSSSGTPTMIAVILAVLNWPSWFSTPRPVIHYITILAPGFQPQFLQDMLSLRPRPIIQVWKVSDDSFYPNCDPAPDFGSQRGPIQWFRFMGRPALVREMFGRHCHNLGKLYQGLCLPNLVPTEGGVLSVGHVQMVHLLGHVAVCTPSNHVTMLMIALISVIENIKRSYRSLKRNVNQFWGQVMSLRHKITGNKVVALIRGRKQGFRLLMQWAQGYFDPDLSEQMVSLVNARLLDVTPFHIYGIVRGPSFLLG